MRKFWKWIATTLIIPAALCFAADALFDGFDGTEGNHVDGWYDATNPGPSYASADFIYSNQASRADIITLPDSQGYGEVYKEFITVDTTVYKYLQVKIDSVTNTATTWEIGLNTFQGDTWLGNMNHIPCAAATTLTGFFSFDISNMMGGGEPHHFVISFTVSGIWDEINELWYGYDGDTVRVDYIRLSDTDGEQATPTPVANATVTATPTATPTPYPPRTKQHKKPVRGNGRQWFF